MNLEAGLDHRAHSCHSDGPLWILRPPASPRDVKQSGLVRNRIVQIRNRPRPPLTQPRNYSYWVERRFTSHVRNISTLNHNWYDLLPYWTDSKPLWNLIAPARTVNQCPPPANCHDLIQFATKSTAQMAKHLTVDFNSKLMAHSDKPIKLLFHINDITNQIAIQYSHQSN